MKLNEEKLKGDILFQIDMQLYDEFNDKICEINEHLGDIYTYKDLRDIEDAEKEKERTLLREAIKKQQKEIEKLKFNNHMVKKWNEQLDKNCISKDQIREKIDKYREKLEKLHSQELWNEPEDSIKDFKYNHYLEAYKELLEEK